MILDLAEAGKHGGENGDNRDDHEQFDQRERTPATDVFLFFHQVGYLADVV